MAVTNAEIICSEQLRLLDEGVLHYTGRKVRGINPFTGEECEVDEIQPLHTYSKWRSLGYQVKRGEKAIANFSIWKYTNRKPKDSDEDEVQKQGRGYCFMKESAFFTDTQVERIKEKS